METLAARIARDGALIEIDAVGWTVRLCKRIEILHGAGATHGNLSAECVRMEATPAASRGLLARVDQATPNPGYHSPERAASGGASVADDTWAVAIILYLALTGSVPFSGVDESEVHAKILASPPAPLAVFDVGDDELQTALDAAFERDGATRTATVATLRAKLEKWLLKHSSFSLLPLEDEESDAGHAKIAPTEDPPTAEGAPQPLAQPPATPRSPTIRQPAIGRTGVTTVPRVPRPGGASVPRPKPASEARPAPAKAEVPRDPPSARSAPASSSDRPAPASSGSAPRASSSGSAPRASSSDRAPPISSGTRELLAVGPGATPVGLHDPEDDEEDDLPTLMMDGAALRQAFPTRFGHPTTAADAAGNRAAPLPAAGAPPPAAVAPPPSQPGIGAAGMTPAPLSGGLGGTVIMPSPLSPSQLDMTVRLGSGPYPLPVHPSASSASPVPPPPPPSFAGSGPDSAMRQSFTPTGGGPHVHPTVVAPVGRNLAIVAGASALAVIVIAIVGAVMLRSRKDVEPTPPKSVAGNVASADAPQAAGSASTAPEGVTPVDNAQACLVGLFPEDTFQEQPPSLEFVCSETDPHRGVSAIRGEIVRASGQKRVSDAMREWAVLGWYDMAAFAVMRTRCCPSAPPLVTPEVPVCPRLDGVLTDLGARAIASQTVDDPALATATETYATTTRCLSRAGASSRFGDYRPLQGGEDIAFRKTLARVVSSVPR